MDGSSPRSRTLIWALASVVALFLVIVGVAVALILPARSHTEASPTSSVTEAPCPPGRGGSRCRHLISPEWPTPSPSPTKPWW